MCKSQLEVNNLSFSYPDGNNAINDISFTIQEGESIGIIGANGAGKSTLLMLLLGILNLNKGEILVEGVKLEKRNLALIREKMGMVFQNPDDQLFFTNVYEDIAFGPRNYNLNESEVRERVIEALYKVGASSLKDRSSFKLSGGEKRLVSIASILAMRPKILIMDEPSSALDPKSRRRLINLLNSFKETKIITSHDLDMILDTCNRILVMKEGKIIADGESKKVLLDFELLDNCGLEKPLSLQNCPICGSVKS